MDELVIRFGYWEGPRNPTAVDLRQALEDIESGQCARPEFTIENVSNWKPEVVDGRRVMHCLSEGRYVHAATFYREGNPAPLGWFVLYNAEDRNRFALSTISEDMAFVDGICCGGPLTVRASCVVPMAVALDALVYFTQYRDRSLAHRWVEQPAFWRLG
jgi:hypothetical protein